METMAQLIRSLSRLPIEVITMIGLRLKDEGEHFLLANLATVSAIREGIIKAYMGTLVLDRLSTRSIVRALPHVSVAIRRSLLNGTKGDWGEISVPKAVTERMKGLLWPNVPCPSDSESEDTQSGWKNGDRTRGKEVGKRMTQMLGEVVKLNVVELPRATDCAALVAVAKSRLESESLCGGVCALTLGPGVYDTMLDWKDRHDGETHPFLMFYLEACGTTFICIDYARTITEEMYIDKRLGLDLVHSDPETRWRRRARLSKLWRYFDNYGRYGARLFGPGADETPYFITIHNADQGLCYGYKNCSYRLFYNRLSTRDADENPALIPRIRQLTYFMRQTHQKLNGDPSIDEGYEVILPSVEDTGEVSDGEVDVSLISKVREKLYGIMEVYSYSKNKEDLKILKDTCDNVTLVALEEAAACRCCGRK